MEKVRRSENLKLLPLAVLLIITPLLSTSLRFKYLYLIVNILIISVGAEAGLFSFFLHSEDNRKPSTPPVSSLPQKSAIASDSDDAPTKPAKDVGEAAVEPSIFFIEASESEEEDDDDDEEMVEENNVEDHELYHKSEKFIGNFYKQLKMQREKSWGEIH